MKRLLFGAYDLG